MLSLVMGNNWRRLSLLGVAITREMIRMALFPILVALYINTFTDWLMNSLEMQLSILERIVFGRLSTDFGAFAALAT